MRNLHEMFLLLAIIVADTLWIFPVLGVLGYVTDQGGSPLPLPLVFALLALSVAAGHAVPRMTRNASEEGAAQALLGIFAVYFAIALVAGEDGIDLLWGPHLLSGRFSGRAIAGLIIGSAMVGTLWFRGIRIAGETRPRVQLQTCFRAGIVGLAVTILAEQAMGADFSATVMIVPFFAVCLGGLAFGRMAGSGTWPRTIGLAVLSVIGGGLLIGLIGAVFGGSGLQLVAAVWRSLLALISWVLTVLLAPVLEAIFSFVTWLIGDYVPPNPAERVDTPHLQDWLQGIQPESLPSYLQTIIEFARYPVLLLVIYLLYRFLLSAYRAYNARAALVAAVDRESIRGNANAAVDLANLALGLLPDWMLPGGSGRDWRYPKGRPGITEAYALYFDLLGAARKRGHEFVPARTPRERCSELAAALPGAPVTGITDVFNAACYGNVPAAPETVERLRRALDRALTD